MTIISDGKKFVFLRPIRHGTTSIEHYYKALFRKTRDPGRVWIRGWRRHLPYVDLVSFYPRIEGYDLITAVRNPWDYLISCYYKHYKDKGWSEEEARTKFNIWIRSGKYERLMAGDPEHYPLNMGIDKFKFIIRFEHLEEDIKDLNLLLGLQGAAEENNIVFPHRRNRGSYRKNFEFYYDSDTAEIVREKYSKVIDHFGYKIDKRKLRKK